MEEVSTPLESGDEFNQAVDHSCLLFFCGSTAGSHDDMAGVHSNYG